MLRRLTPNIKTALSKSPHRFRKRFFQNESKSRARTRPKRRAHKCPWPHWIKGLVMNLLGARHYVACFILPLLIITAGWSRVLPQQQSRPSPGGPPSEVTVPNRPEIGRAHV